MTTLDLSRYSPEVIAQLVDEAELRGDFATLGLVAQSLGVNLGHGNEAAVETMSHLVLPDGRLWGEAAELWQWDDAVAVLTDQRRLHYLTRPRGSSKTSDMAGVAIAAVKDQLPPGSAGYAFAADKDQAALLLQAAQRWLISTPGLDEHIELQALKLINRQTRAWIQIMPADAAGAFGLVPQIIFVDELAQWGSTQNPLRVWEAIVSAIQKVPGCRLVVFTSAGAPGHWSYGVLETARSRSAWRVSEVQGPVPWTDPEDLEEQRALLTESQYARLHLNIWMAPEDVLVTPEVLRRCVVLDGPLPPRDGVKYVITFDLGITKDRSVAAVMHAEPIHEDPDGIVLREGETVEQAAERVERGRIRGMKVVLDQLKVWRGSKDRPVTLDMVEEWLYEQSMAYNRAAVVGDPWQAEGMLQRLRKRRVPARKFVFTQTSIGRLATTLYTLLRDGLYELPDEPDLLAELTNVRLRETSAGTMRLDHEAGQHDDQAVTIALGAQMLLKRGGGEGPRVRVSTG